MPIYRRLAFRIAAFTSALMLLTVAYFCYNAYQREHRALEDRFGLALERIVATAALSIDGDAHTGIRTLADTKSETFKYMREGLRLVQKANYLREDLLYTFNIDPNTRELRAALMLQPVPYTGDTYSIPEVNRVTFLDSIRSRRAGHSRLYSDENGMWVSAWAPIFDSDQHVVGVIQADYDISKFEKELEKELLNILILSILSTLMVVLISALFARGLERALNAIRLGAQSIEDERYDYRIDVSRRDELGVVAQQFNRMAEVLGERFHLLKFIPSHTLEAVSRKARDGASEEVERINASILFSDIRGFTKMSEGLRDEDVVRMLNHYLRVQAEIVEEHGGAIDKFIGDAVLALFKGEGHQQHAVNAALAIQEKVASLNVEKVFEREVRIGIGIASGDMVYAELGSDARKERTIIGSIVNLASRLCSAANADEVVVSDEVTSACECDNIEKVSSASVPLKGIDAPVLCHVIKTKDSV